MRQGSGKRNEGRQARKAGAFRPLSDSVTPGAFATGASVMLELLRGRWKAMAGEGLWSYSWPMSLSDRRLTVAVDSTTALAAVRGLKERILERVRAIPSLREVRSLVFRVDPEFMAMARSGGDPALSEQTDTAGGHGETEGEGLSGTFGCLSAEGRRLGSEMAAAGKPELGEAFRKFLDGIEIAMGNYRKLGFENCSECGKQLTPGGRRCLNCETELSEARLLKVEDLLLDIPWLSLAKVAERYPGTTAMEYARATQWVSEALERRMWDAFYAYKGRPDKETYVALERAASSFVMLATGLEPVAVTVDSMKDHAPQDILKALAGGK